MNLSDFLKKFLMHIAMASMVLLVVLLLGEFFVPGSVMPFIDLVDFAVIVLFLLIASLYFGWKEGRSS